jgi:uncharacterized protein YybS (DUF2232 family)
MVTQKRYCPIYLNITRTLTLFNWTFANFTICYYQIICSKNLPFIETKIFDIIYNCINETLIFLGFYF